MLVGKIEPSWIDRFYSCQCWQSGRVTPAFSSAAMPQPPMTWALPILVSRGFIGRASIAALVSAHVAVPRASSWPG